MDTPFTHPDWRIENTPLGKEIAFQPRKGGAAFLVPFVAAALIALACLWGLWTIAGGWLRGEEILPGGIILVLLLIGGLFFARRCLRLAFRHERYLLGAAALRVMRGASAEPLLIERAAIVEILQLYTPPKEAGAQGIWRTCLVYRAGTKPRNECFLEGYDKNVSDYLASELSGWAGVAARTENTITAGES